MVTHKEIKSTTLKQKRNKNYYFKTEKEGLCMLLQLHPKKQQAHPQRTQREGKENVQVNTPENSKFAFKYL